MASSVILIGGPTASGKSAMAMRLARERNGCIINADAMQIYAGMPILTAQPEAEDRAEIPHCLYGTVCASDAFSVGKWLQEAKNAMAKAVNARQTPILVGGTGLYFAAFLGGLADIPPIPDSARIEAAKLYDALGEENFRAELALRDPQSATRIARNDRQRLIRAYEVVMHTGKSLSYWQKEASGISDQDSGKEFEAERHLILPSRDELYAACDRRFLTMIERGAIDEVKRLLSLDLPPALPAMKILGVREIAAFLRGEISLDAAIAKAQQMTRNYAKRQMTWFRNQWKTP
ncbi:MAG: tRNA (adenosine(37)-N6)-dimethylallyltransferase MiaA [Alphaproteobacteria bacterium]|nr:tRNA (adenosine(37)-N6)-dimethylallyltransferase MiaA [Alphaproteobacteria bacterium]